MSFFHIFLHAKKDMATGGRRFPNATGKKEKRKLPCLEATPLGVRRIGILVWYRRYIYIIWLYQVQKIRSLGISQATDQNPPPNQIRKRSLRFRKLPKLDFGRRPILLHLSSKRSVIPSARGRDEIYHLKVLLIVCSLYQNYPRL